MKKDNIHQKTAFVVITVARQIDGEYVFIKTEKGFHSAGKADNLLKKLKSSYVDEEGKPKIIKLTTEQGDAECICEVGAFEVEIEKDE